ncbi:MAG: 6,7-dimethyl-8-ribityllumazine synthase [Acidisphaera sp.]|nr:6,7-dimethyl-8-ribityllumazine synthase [Acidisphaera sp.]MBV9812202.1 6,7-dimethyl-8-ribityllumazine synthase [Acetobacteraceae bacterium]
MSTADAPLPTPPRVPGVAPYVLIVRAPYYVDVVDGLRDGAVRILDGARTRHEVLDVAGALELAPAIRFAVAGFRHFDAYVALGCVVRGETDHYDHVCREAMSGLTQVALMQGLALGNGLLTVDTVEQARARSALDGFNKGAEAAVAALKQVIAARWLGRA